MHITYINIYMHACIYSLKQHIHICVCTCMYAYNVSRPKIRANLINGDTQSWLVQVHGTMHWAPTTHVYIYASYILDEGKYARMGNLNQCSVPKPAGFMGAKDKIQMICLP